MSMSTLCDEPCTSRPSCRLVGLTHWQIAGLFSDGGADLFDVICAMAVLPRLPTTAVKTLPSSCARTACRLHGSAFPSIRYFVRQ